jgi:amidase
MDANDPTTLPNPVPDMTGNLDAGVKGIKIGFDEQYATQDVEPELAAAVADSVHVMERLGAEIIPVTVPPNLREYLAAWAPICEAEAVAAHADTYPSRSDEYGPWFREWLKRGASLSAADYADANVLRAACVGDLRNTMRGIDLLACPTMATAAYPVTSDVMYGTIQQELDPWMFFRFTVPADFSGLPTISLPCGLNGDGLPLSLQFVGHHLSEELLVQAGHSFEGATDFHNLHPPV